MGDDKSSFRVASFSYYLDTAKDNTMLHKISAQEIPILLNNPNKTTLTNLRVGSFSYLNDHGGANYFSQCQLENVGTGARSNSTRSGTDATGYNSRVSLQAKQKKGINARRLFLGGFWCHGSCFHKKGVHLTQLVADEPNIAARPGSESLAENTLEEPRNSIEVFGAGATFKGEVAKNLERKLSMLTWDAIPKPQTTATSAVVHDDDVASDASSDLFEIQNISRARHPITTDDDASICMSPASVYAPSEASIQWSVVTTSAIDYSGASDYNDDMSVSVAGDALNRSTNKEAQNGRHGGFLGCRSHKAVDVVQNVTSKNQDRAKHLPTLNH